MFAKLSTLVLLLPYASALTINALIGAASGGQVQITWTASTTDPSSFSIELVNTAFHNTYAIANNVATALGTLSITLPQVPVQDGYTIEAVAVNNVNTVYSQSSDFSIGASSSSSSSAASTASASTSTSATDTATATISTASASVPTTSATFTIPVSSASSSTTAASSSTASSTPSSFSSGAASFKGLGVAPAAVLALSAVAGAAMVF